MGLTDLVKFNVWTIESIDDGVSLKIEGDYPPEGFRSSKEGAIGVTGRPGGSPTVTYNGDGAEVLTWGATWKSDNFAHDRRDVLDSLRAVRQMDIEVGRAPLMEFSWGEHQLAGFVKVSYSVSGYWAATGFPKIIRARIELVEEATEAGSADEGGETTYVKLATGETFEILAARLLGNPMRAENVRRINPTLASGAEKGGDRVKVFERSHPEMRARPAPTSLPFLVVDDWGPVLQDRAEARGVTRNGLPWRLLPEVIAGDV